MISFNFKDWSEGGRTNGEHTKTHCSSVLDRKMSETSSSSRQTDPITNLSVAVLDSAVNSDTLRNIQMS